MAQYYQDEEWSTSETEESDVAIETRSRVNIRSHLIFKYWQAGCQLNFLTILLQDRIGKPTMKQLEVVNNNKVAYTLYYI